ncbi:MAG TPA: LCP family protein [Segeticoccus sp.]|uniref:LCP family protein n=1 Tax=Segeticoccus sp. TaxID=2706531 RepID=UPI002D7E4257|nr:LCP family protein [Segeticoccus sp.]HET8599136.1 LCP family protein [Segeticoccus sp.]
MPATTPRTAIRSTAAVGVALAVALSGCTSSDGSAARSSSPTSSSPAPKASSSSPAKPHPRVSVAGVPTALAKTVRQLYAGKPVPAPAPLRRVLAQRATSHGRVKAHGNVASWKSSKIAVVTARHDVTLAVQGKHGWHVVGGWWPSMKVRRPQLGGTRHVLLMGSDARVSHGQEVARSRADSLHVIGLDGRGGAGVLGIPRDSWVSLATGGPGKINSAMAYGGPTAELKTVRHVTGLPIEGYLLTGFVGFRHAIDAFGGLPFDAPKAVIDPTHHNSGADVKKGKQHLNGDEALAYARERKSLPDGDFGRSRNQGWLLLAGAALVRGGGPEKLPRYLHELSPYVTTDLSAQQVLTLAAHVFTLNPHRVRNEVATGGFGVRGGGQSVVLLGSGARHLFHDLRDGTLSGGG